MARRRLLTACVLTGVLVSVPLVAHAETTTCTKVKEEGGLCATASNDDENDGVGLDGEIQGGFTVPDSSSSGDKDDSLTRVETRIFEGTTDGVTFDCVGEISDLCVSIRRGPRISDMVSFGAAPPTLAMEPASWIATGLPANFIAGARSHVRSGLLLGQPASVEFIPVGYRFDYGDGETVSTVMGGATWEGLGLAEFDHTPTSHIFSESGTYTITASVIYRTRFAFASNGEWYDIPGTLSVDSSMTATAYRVKTVLVDKSCLERPDGPGC